MAVVLISGCSRGIGHHAALALARRGWTVIGTLRGEEGRAELEAAGVQTTRLDVCDEAGARRVVAEVLARNGGLDAVVANAGQGLFGCFEDLDSDEIRALFEINLFGAMHLVRAALPGLRTRRGRVVLISSVAGRRAAPGSGAYNASKFAMEGWGEALRFELAPFGVPVTLVEPGATVSGFVQARREGARVGQGPYAAISARLRALQASMVDGSDPVEVVVAPLLRVLEQPHPPLRVVTGRSARAQLLAGRLLPARVYEWLALRKLALPAAVG